MKLNDSPCVPNCPNRVAEPNCHCTCEKYKEFRSEKEKEYARKQSILTTIGYYSEKKRAYAKKQIRKGKSKI